jgi:hypothetical protein
MTHIANQRIKLGGEYYRPGDPITPSEQDLEDLPKGAASPKPDFVETVADAAVKLQGALLEIAQDNRSHQQTKLDAAVAELTDADFKKDGDIRADSLKQLVQKLGFDVTAEQVGASKETLATQE